ncbi:hypothetical protein [Hymenobacter sp. B81]|uniref:hypothetical protein n=1 Tax=Hymenobacter sp. B81 TaxID=3344878 RepID=UPI0037DD3052
MADETVILRVQLDEAKTQERLQALVLEIEKTRTAQGDLNVARAKGKVTDEEYAKQAVALRQQLKAQTVEQTAHTKNLELYRASVNGVAGSYDQVQNQLTLAQRQFRGLADSSTDSTEETKALSAVIRELRGNLKELDSTSLDQHYRNIGNYPKGQMEDFVRELVKLREEEKNLAAGSKELAANQDRQVGFMTAAQRAAAQAGKSYNEASKDIENYARQIQPATAELVQLAQAQSRLVESGEQASESFKKIGFQIGKLEKDIQEVPVETKKVSDRLAELDDTTGAFGGRISGLKDAWTSAKGGFDTATKGLSGVRVAMLAVPIFAIIAGLTALYAWFTRTQEGADFVERKTKAVSVVFGVLADKIAPLGKALAQVFENPGQAVRDFGQLLVDQVIVRFQALGVLLEAVQNGDLTQLRDGFVQLGTGITDATAKAKALRTELLDAAAAGEDIAREFQRIRDEERRINVERAQAKKDIEALKLVAEDVTKSTAERLEATREAFALEQRSVAAQLQAQRDRVANMEREATLTNQMTADNDALAEERIKLAELEEGSLTRQIELNNKLNELRQQATERSLADSKAYYERLALLAEKGSQAELNARIGVIRAERDAQLAAQGLTANQRRLIVTQAEQQISEVRQGFRQAELQARLGQLDLELQSVARNSDEELNLLRRKLDTQRRLELAAKDLTIGQVRLINARAAAEETKLTLDNVRGRAAAALQIEVNNIAARMAFVERGSAQELQLQRDAIERQRQQQIAAIDERASAEERASQERVINARAGQQQEELVYQDRLRGVRAYYQQERNALEEARATGLITEQQYQGTLYEQQRAALVAQRELAVRFGRDTAELDQHLTDLKIANLDRLTDKERDAAQQRAAITAELAQLVGQFFADSVNNAGQALDDFARKAILVLVESVEKAILAAQIKILTDSFSRPDSVTTFGASGAVRAALIIAATTAATAPIKALLSQPSGNKFALGGIPAEGGVVMGPAHAQGGVQLWHKSGAHLGEMEGREIILAKGVYDSPLLRPLASILNVMGGGRPFSGFSRHMALGGVTQSAFVRDSLSGHPIGLDYDRLAQSLGKVNIYTKTQEVMTSMEKVKYTEALSRD